MATKDVRVVLTQLMDRRDENEKLVMTNQELEMTNAARRRARSRGSVGASLHTRQGESGVQSIERVQPSAANGADNHRLPISA